MELSESDYYQSRSATEWQLAKSAHHPEARRRHAELASRYSELVGRGKNNDSNDKCYGLVGNDPAKAVQLSGCSS